MKTLSSIKLKWQRHNRDHGLSWNEISTLIDEVEYFILSDKETDEELTEEDITDF